MTGWCERVPVGGWRWQYRLSLWGDPFTFWAPPTCRRSNRASVLVSLWELRVSRRGYRAVMLETASSLSGELQQRLFKECNCWRKTPAAKLEEASWRCESGVGVEYSSLKFFSRLFNEIFSLTRYKFTGVMLFQMKIPRKSFVYHFDDKQLKHLTSYTTPYILDTWKIQLEAILINADIFWF